jgi:hypothetical protein
MREAFPCKTLTPLKKLMGGKEDLLFKFNLQISLKVNPCDRCWEKALTNLTVCYKAQHTPCMDTVF